MRILTSTELYLHAIHYSHASQPSKESEEKSAFSKESLFTSTLSSAGWKVYDDARNPIAAIEEEAWQMLVVENATFKNWGTLLHMFALATVVKRTIHSIYPDANPPLRHYYNRTLHPREIPFRVSEKHQNKIHAHPDIYILWSRSGSLDNRHHAPYQPNHFVPFLIDITQFQFDIEPAETEADKTNTPGGRDQYSEPSKEDGNESEETKTQEEHSSGGELPEDETTCKDPETEEKHSGGNELPKDEEPKTQEDHSSGGDLANVEITSEETKSQGEHSSGGDLPKDETRSEENKSQEEHSNGGDLSKDETTSEENKSQQEHPSGGDLPTDLTTIEENKSQEEHSSGGDLPKDETTSEENKSQEKQSSGGDLPKDETASEESKSKEEHPSGGDLPKDETTSEENKSQEEHSSGGDLPKDETTSAENKSQEEQSSGGDLPKDETTSEENKSQEKQSSGGDLPKDETASEESKSQEEHPSGGDLPKDETTSEENKSQEEHSSGGDLPQDETTSEENKSQEEHPSGGDLPKDETTSEENKSQEEHPSGGDLPRDETASEEPKSHEKQEDKLRTLGPSSEELPLSEVFSQTRKHLYFDVDEDTSTERKYGKNVTKDDDTHMTNIETKVTSTNKKNKDEGFLSSDDNVPLSKLSSKQGDQPHSLKSSTNSKNSDEGFLSTDDNVPLSKLSSNKNEHAPCPSKKSKPSFKRSKRGEAKSKAKSVKGKRSSENRGSNEEETNNGENRKSEDDDAAEILEEYESDTQEDILGGSESELSDCDETDEENDDSIKWNKYQKATKTPTFQGPTPGPALNQKKEYTPIDLFYEFLPESMFTKIAVSTNQYVPIYTENRKKVKSFYAEKEIDDITEDDIKAYIGVRMIMGVDPKPALSDYWSANPALKNQAVSDTMSRSMFELIQRYFHVNDPKKDPARIKDQSKRKKEVEQNPLYKVQPLFEEVRKNCIEKYNLHQHISVDEAMIKFMGQHWCIVGAPNKPAKRGFKIFCMCDGETGYMKDFHTYIRKKKQTGLTQRVVEQLSENIHERNHIIYVDKFYTSIDLATSLLGNGTYLCGSFHSGRKNFPMEIKPNKKLRKRDDPVRNLKQGQSMARQSNCGKLTACAWMDSALVLNLSTCFKPVANQRKDVVERKTRSSDGKYERKVIACPESIVMFNKYMGGVDQHDHLRSSYSLQRQSTKWWLYFAWFAIDVALVNGYLIGRAIGRKESHKDYQLKVPIVFVS